MTTYKKQKSANDLPQTIRLFPLAEITLLPQTQLPLNIFEKKYIAMIDDAMATDRLIGMIQPVSDDNHNKLHQIGCIGRITSFQEASKGQYQITLLGLCRFKLISEIDQLETADSLPVYRHAEVDYKVFKNDFTKPSKERQQLINRERLILAIKDMLQQIDLEIDWQDLVDTPNEMLVNAISMTSPFKIAEKQALLEAPTVADRSELLITLSQMSLNDLADKGDLIQ